MIPHMQLLWGIDAAFLLLYQKDKTNDKKHQGILYGQGMHILRINC